MSDMYLYRNGDWLMPATKAAALELSKLPFKEWVRVTIKRDRNARHHAKFWAFCTYVAEALNAGPGHTTKEEVCRWLKIRMRYYRLIPLPSKDAEIAGESHAVEYLSIAFDKMDQQAFETFYATALELIEEQLCPYLMQSDHKAEILAIIADNRRAA